jgi:hypothetical protein
LHWPEESVATPIVAHSRAAAPLSAAMIPTEAAFVSFECGADI